MQQNIEFERCIDFLVRMIDKYGDEVLRELEEEKQNKQEKADVSWLVCTEKPDFSFWHRRWCHLV